MQGHHHLGRGNRGFTLIELLVTMVILSFVIAVMSGAFSQVAQIVRIASESGNSFQTRWVQARALHDAVGHLVLSDTGDPPFTGDSQRVRCLTLASPVAKTGVVQSLDLRLQPASDGRGTVLMLRAQAAPTSFDGDFSESLQEPVPIEWVRWGEEVEFRFQDREGEQHANWPPFGKPRETLPSALLLRGRNGGQTLWRSAVFEGLSGVEENLDMRDVMGIRQ